MEKTGRTQLWWKLPAVAAGAAMLAACLAAPAQGIAAGANSSPLCSSANYDWDEMSQSMRNAWQALGWNKSRWQANRAPASEAKDWDELTVNERRAAQSLGATANSWNSSKC